MAILNKPGPKRDQKGRTRSPNAADVRRLREKVERMKAEMRVEAKEHDLKMRKAWDVIRGYDIKIAKMRERTRIYLERANDYKLALELNKMDIGSDADDVVEGMDKMSMGSEP